jgi:hypothetical protein
MSALIVERFFANRDPDRIAQQMSPLINVISRVSQSRPLCPKLQTRCCPATNDV